MMYRKSLKRKVILLALLLIIVTPMDAYSAEDDAIFIIYDSYKEYGSQENLLNIVVEKALSLGLTIKIREVSNYDERDIVFAKGVIALNLKDDSSVVDNFNKISSLNKEVITIGKGNVDISIDKIKNDRIYILEKIITEKFGLKNTLGTYFLIDDVYPFDDLNLIIEKVDYLYNRGIPFMVAAMPVFQNQDFEAMKRYAEVLRYCSSKGGMVVLSSPYIYNTSSSEDELIKKMDAAQKVFTDYWIYPSLLKVPESWIYRDDRKDYLSKTNSIIISKKDENIDYIGRNYDIKAFDNVLIIEDNPDTRGVVSVIGRENFDTFKSRIDGAIKDGIRFSNGEKTIISNITFGNRTIINNYNGLFLNSKKVGGKRFISMEDFNEMFPKNESLEEGINLSNINRKITFIAFVSICVFLIFFLHSRRIDRRKYFK